MKKPKLPNTSCTTCHKEFYKKPNEILKSKSGNVFCSKTCTGIFNRREKPCVICGKPILSSACKATCSKECAKANYKRPNRIHSIGRPKISQKKKFFPLKRIENYLLAFEEISVNCAHIQLKKL